MDGEQIMAIAKSRDVQAIIPGYRFLSDNAAFAQAIAAAGLIFVGPSPEAIESFGLKHTARELALAAGVPVVPGSRAWFTPKDIVMCFSTAWKVSPTNAARGGIRLVGPRPEYARGDGGDGGSHPSNVFEYGYPTGGLNWIGDEPVLFQVDCPDFGGFLCSLTVIRADFWKLGQLRAGDSVRFHRVDLDTALACRRRHERFLQSLASCVEKNLWDDAVTVGHMTLSPLAVTPGQDVVASLDATETQPRVTYRSGADDYLLVEYGDCKMDLEMKCRSTALKRALESATGAISTSQDQGGLIYNLVACGSSLAVWYNGLELA